MEKFKKAMVNIGKDIVENIKTKWIGCFIGLGALLLTLINIIVYSSMTLEIHTSSVAISLIIGAVIYILLSLFKQTSNLAPISLMVFNLLAFLLYVQADGIIDYFSTQFFGGFSVAGIFQLPFTVWFSIFAILLSFIIASVSMYFPQNKKVSCDKEADSSTELVSENKEN